MAKIEGLVMKNVMKADLYQDMKTVLSNISRKVKIVGNEHTERMKFDWDVSCMAIPVVCGVSMGGIQK